MEKRGIIFTLDAFIALTIMFISILVFIGASIHPTYYSYQNVKDKTFSYATLLTSTRMAELTGNLTDLGIDEKYYDSDDSVIKVISYLAYTGLKQKADNLTMFLINKSNDIIDKKYNINITIFDDVNSKIIYSIQNASHSFQESDNTVAYNTIVFGSRDIDNVWGPFVVRVIVWD